ncbi:hypothetical protein QUA81_28770 [Microcoleus sp. F6_B4]
MGTPIKLLPPTVSPSFLGSSFATKALSARFANTPKAVSSKKAPSEIRHHIKSGSIGIIPLCILSLCVLERPLRLNHSDATGNDIIRDRESYNLPPFFNLLKSQAERTVYALLSISATWVGG